MNRWLRRIFPYAAVVLMLGAFAWAVNFGTLPPAEFTFDNNTEVQTIDPAISSGQPEGRVIDGLFEGLLRGLPDQAALATAKKGDLLPLTPSPAVAESYTLSEDGKTYTFRIRPTARWSDGTPMTAEDFRFSWMRMLHPETVSKYASLLHYIRGTEAFNTATVNEGDAVEVELNDRPQRHQTFPRGTIVRGTLEQLIKPPPPDLTNVPAKKKEKLQADWKERWVYVVVPQSVEPSAKWSAEDAARLKKELTGKIAVSSHTKTTPEWNGSVLEGLHVLPDFQTTVGLLAPDPATLVVELKNPTPYFTDLVAFYPLFPVQRQCVEKYGVPKWTKAENLVSNGPYKMQFRRLRDRMRLVKSEHYWNADAVKIKTVDILAMKLDTTALNMYLNGQIDWNTNVTGQVIHDVAAKRPDELYTCPMLTVYFYRLNTQRPPLDNKKVRQALAYAVDRQQIVDYVTKAGEIPARHFVPPGLRGYQSPLGPTHDIAKAKELLAEAGYPGGKGLPPLEILYNAQGSHQEIAEVIQQQWREQLGIEVTLRNLEWGVFLDSLHKLDYVVARSGWIGDYPDPNTFLDMFVTGGANNETGWSNARYDELIAATQSERDHEKRMALFVEAETILMDELPIIPFHFSVSKHLVRPHVQGFFNNTQDIHPLTLFSVPGPAGGKQ